MSAPHPPSCSARFAHCWIRLALRFWPAESRDWGRALAAELDSIHSPVETVRWAFGGTLLFTRALVSHSLAWLRLPVGARLNGGLLGNSPLLPRRSRLFSGALLVATAAILCLPQGRQALSAVKMSWGFPEFHSGDRALERIGRQADHENDARTLAFVALALSHPVCCPLQYPPDAIHYADRAVAVDPSLAWIYTGMVRMVGFRADQSEWLARLKASDPENAVPNLLSADAIVSERYQTLIQRHTLTDLDVQASLENDAQWLGEMDRAISAGRFDTYSKNYFDLFRAFYRQNPSLDPSTYLMGSLGGRVPHESLNVYVSILTRRARRAGSVKSFATATGELEHVAQFGERVAQQSEDDMSGWVVRCTAIEALGGLKAALVQRGHTEEAAAVGDRLQRLEHEYNHRKSICRAPGGLGRRALLVHSLGFAFVLFSSLFLLSLAILEIPVPGQWKLRRFLRMPACLIADLCPTLLVVTCAAFLYSYQPFARAFEAHLSQSSSLFDLQAIWGTYMSLESLPGKIREAVTPVRQWIFATALLALLALFILARGLFRTDRSVRV